mmetsp:Transcript_2743/g.7644  ORF Transcript_2743/g.7644 Transcript_2743/m.7644 type:complete len:200 (-) Transcript_2743:100-699(-)
MVLLLVLTSSLLLWWSTTKTPMVAAITPTLRMMTMPMMRLTTTTQLCLWRRSGLTWIGRAAVGVAPVVAAAAAVHRRGSLAGQKKCSARCCRCCGAVHLAAALAAADAALPLDSSHSLRSHQHQHDHGHRRHRRRDADADAGGRHGDAVADVVAGLLRLRPSLSLRPPMRDLPSPSELLPWFFCLMRDAGAMKRCDSML